MDAKWAYGRRSCVCAIARIIETVGTGPLGDISELLNWFVVLLFVLELRLFGGDIMPN